MMLVLVSSNTKNLASFSVSLLLHPLHSLLNILHSLNWVVSNSEVGLVMLHSVNLRRRTRTTSQRALLQLVIREGWHIRSHQITERVCVVASHVVARGMCALRESLEERRTILAMDLHGKVEAAARTVW